MLVYSILNSILTTQQKNQNQIYTYRINQFLGKRIYK